MRRTEAGRSSARRKPVWTFVEEGVKIDLSLMVTSTALVLFASNFHESVHFSPRHGVWEFYQRGIDGRKQENVTPFQIYCSVRQTVSLMLKLKCTYLHQDHSSGCKGLRWYQRMPVWRSQGLDHRTGLGIFEPQHLPPD